MKNNNINVIHVYRGDKGKQIGCRIDINGIQKDINMSDAIALIRNQGCDNAIIVKINSKMYIKGTKGKLKAITRTNTNNRTKIVYHGAPNIVKRPEYNKGENKRDYGNGLYTTQNKELAKEWAVGTTKKEGYCNIYEIDTNGLKILDLDRLGVVHWIAEILSHRSGASSKADKSLQEKFIGKYKIDTSGYDIIHGYRADDAYFGITKLFLRGMLDTQRLYECLKLGNLGKQIFIKSEKAFKRIKFIGYETAEADKYLKQAQNKDEDARRKFEDISSQYIESRVNMNGTILNLLGMI